MISVSAKANAATTYFRFHTVPETEALINQNQSAFLHDSAAIVKRSITVERN